MSPRLKLSGIELNLKHAPHSEVVMKRICIVLFLLMLCYASTAMAQEATFAPTQVAPGEAQNLILRRVAPIYPLLARQAQIQGTVILNIIVTKEGDVRKLQLVSGHPMLAPAAIEAVKQWKYRPFEHDGQPVDFQTTVQVNFKLADHPPALGVVGDQPGGVPPEGAAAAQVHICETPTDNSLPQRVRVSSGVMQGLRIEKKSPAYPEEARSQHIQGTVVLAMEVSKDGSVCDLALVSGHPLLAPAALDAVKQWKYRPYLLNGTPVEVETQVTVIFTLAE